MLKDLFCDGAESPIVRVDGEIVVVKLRSTERERVTPLGGQKDPDLGQDRSPKGQPKNYSATIS